MELGKLAVRMNSPESPVISVNMADDFDWRTDTIADQVHPNARGAAKMATKWFAALTNVMEKPAHSFDPRLVTYKKLGDTELKLHVFASTNSAGKPRPAIMFFFGGGWTSGTPIQFYPECAHFAAKGFVAINADYRIAAVNHTTPFASLTDGKSAIRWVRQHATDLGIDPQRIVAAGASAGGQIAAAAGIVSGWDDLGDDLSVSSKPNALLLWYAVVDNSLSGYGPPEMKARWKEISPLHNITSNAPPILFLLGTKDPYTPVMTAELFKARMNEVGVRCDLKLFPGAGHPIYEWRKGSSPLRDVTLARADEFLSNLGFAGDRPSR